MVLLSKSINTLYILTMLVMTLFSATATAQQKDTVVTAVGYTTSERDDMTGKMIVQSFINDKLHGVKTVSLEKTFAMKTRI